MDKPFIFGYHRSRLILFLTRRVFGCVALRIESRSEGVTQEVSPAPYWMGV